MACLMIVGFAACGNSQKAPTESTSVDESPSAQNEEKENKIELDLDSDQNLYYQFAEGLAAVRKNKKWGYVDKHGIVVIPFSFDEARGFSSGLACVKKTVCMDSWIKQEKSLSLLFMIGQFHLRMVCLL